MATSIFRNKNLVRPKKTGAAKRRRRLEQQRRLLALGVDAETVRRLNAKEIRQLLRRPLAVKKSVAAS